jgi:Uma2 family endonuclease
MAATTVSRPPRLTYEDYCLLPDDGKRYELIEGELFVSPSPSTRHQPVSIRIATELQQSLAKPGLATIFPAPTDLLLANTTVVVPDLVIVGAARASIITRRALEGPPDVVVEILSPSSVDRDGYIKRKLYEKFEIPEYWLIDPEENLVTVHRLEGGTYGIRARLDGESVLDSPEFPTLEIALRDVFR